MRMMMAAALAALSLAPMAAAADDTPEQMALEARHGYMLMLGANMSTLAGMAKGDIAYDEAGASRAAANLEALGKYDVSMHFIPKTAQGEIEDSEALPAIWSDAAGFAAKQAAFAEATAGISDAVKGGQDKVGPVVQKLGGTCKACHDGYRAK